MACSGEASFSGVSNKKTSVLPGQVLVYFEVLLPAVQALWPCLASAPSICIAGRGNTGHECPQPRGFTVLSFGQRKARQQYSFLVVGAEVLTACLRQASLDVSGRQQAVTCPTAETRCRDCIQTSALSRGPPAGPVPQACLLLQRQPARVGHIPADAGGAPLPRETEDSGSYAVLRACCWAVITLMG